MRKFIFKKLFKILCPARGKNSAESGRKLEFRPSRDKVSRDNDRVIFVSIAQVLAHSSGTTSCRGSQTDKMMTILPPGLYSMRVQ